MAVGSFGFTPGRRPLLIVLLSVAFPAMGQVGDGRLNANINTPGAGINTIAAGSTQQQAQPLADAYYVTRSGKKVQYALLRDTYVLTLNTSTQNQPGLNAKTAASSLQAEFAADLELTEDATFTGKVRARVLPGKSQKSVLSRLRTRADIDYISPVLLNEKGGELSLTPGVVIRSASGGPLPASVLSQLAAQGLSLQKTLSFTSNEFLFQYSGLIENPSQLFRATRAAMDMPGVAWAEPNFVVAPIKYFTPDDPLYPNQWHLNNTGQTGGQVGADVSAPEGWNLTRATRTVVAVVDDAVDLAHPDLPIWNNPGESGGGKETDGIDNDGNGYIDDYRGWDFGDNDNDPSPALSSDNHGTSVAGVAAAQGNNAIGVSGSASNATILPVRTGAMSCTFWGDAMRYAAKYGDVVNNSWGIGGCESSIDSAIADGVAGTITGARRGDKGTPILFASGNSASGWVKYTLTGISAGNHNFEWLFVKNASLAEGYDTMWLDDITWPGGAFEGFEGSLADFTTSGDANWVLVNDGVHARGATGNSYKAGTITDSQTTSLLATNKAVGAGSLTFWHWVSSEQGSDGLIFYLDGVQQMSFAPGQNGHLNDVGYPASNPNTISIGASNDGGPSGSEERVYYSQFGAALDVVAPSSGGNEGITTTDRMGAAGYEAASDYTSTFGGTSSATPLTSGVVADIIGIYPHITVTQLRDALRAGADQIGPYAYVSGRNDHYGYGRVNLLGSLDWIKNNTLAFDCDLPDKLVADRWAMIGLPCAADAPGTVLSTLGDDLDTNKQGSDWVMGEKRLVGVNNYSTLGASSVVEPGRGYWVKSTLGGASGGAFLDGGTLDIQGTETPITFPALCPSSNGCFVITLNSPASGSPYEWNMVAHPLAYPVDWADVRIVVNDSSIYVPSAAETADYVSATYQVWTGNSYSPKDDVTPGMEGTLQPGGGFWVKTLPGAIGQTIKLMIPAVPSLKTTQAAQQQAAPWYAAVLDWFISPAYAGKRKDDDGSDDDESDDYDRWYTIGFEEREDDKEASEKRQKKGEDWYVRLTVSAPADNLEDTGNVFGQLADSTNGFDRHDLKELPPFARPYLTLVFPHADWGGHAGDYASDFRKPGKKAKWLFEIRTDTPGRDVNLCWEGSENIMERSELIDKARDKKYRLKPEKYAGNCLAIHMDETVKRFRWVYK